MVYKKLFIFDPRYMQSVISANNEINYMLYEMFLYSMSE
jgi:hypothetical protein